MTDAPSRIAVLFSGGTDSTASSALLAQRFAEIHLLTYKRLGFYHSENSENNLKRLAARFPACDFRHRILESTALAKHLTNHRRWSYIRRYGFFTLQNCGFCALTNHVATLAYCRRNGIGHAADGITHDWPFFPGHMDRVIDLFREMYRRFDIIYETPVLGYEIEAPPRYIDKVTSLASHREGGSAVRTTGKLLHELGLAETENYKGTDLDRHVQARCYQFILPNLFIHWVYRGQERWEEYEAVIVEYFGKLVDDCAELLEDYFARGLRRELFAFLDEET